MIALIKYRAGNITSVSNALERLGVDFYLAENTEDLDKADGVIFPVWVMPIRRWNLSKKTELTNG